MRSAARPSKVTATLLPARFDPMTVPSDPATRGVESKVAAFTTLLTVTDELEVGGVPPPDVPPPLPVGGAAVGAGETVSTTGIETLPASGPASMMTLALYVPAARPVVLTKTSTLPLL